MQRLVKRFWEAAPIPHGYRRTWGRMLTLVVAHRQPATRE